MFHLATTEHRCRDSQPNIRLILILGNYTGNPVEEGEEELQDMVVLRTQQESPQRQLTWAHMGSQKHNQQPGSQHETDLGPLHMCTFV